MLFVSLLFLTVNPAEAQGRLHSRVIADGGDTRVFPRDLQPDSLRLIVLGLQPRLEVMLCSKAENRKVIFDGVRLLPFY